MNQLQRLFEIDRLIRAGKAPKPDELAANLGVTRRQIFLDRLFLIEQLKAPLVHDRKRGGWVYSDTAWPLPTVLLVEEEILTLFLSFEIARAGSNPGLELDLDAVIAKISQALGGGQSVDLNAIKAATSFGTSPAARVKAQTLWALLRLQALRQKVQIRYYTISRDARSERVVHPYHLFLTRGEWFLLAFDENRGEVRSFNVARIEAMAPLGAHFQIDPNFDAQKTRRSMLCAEAGAQIYDVVVRFDAYQARYIREREWHLDQNLEELPDDELILRFPASGLPEVARWVLGYGKHAQVLEPPELRKIIVSHLRALTGMYEGGNDD